MGPTRMKLLLRPAPPSPPPLPPAPIMALRVVTPNITDGAQCNGLGNPAAEATAASQTGLFICLAVGGGGGAVTAWGVDPRLQANWLHQTSTPLRATGCASPPPHPLVTVLPLQPSS